MQRSFFKKYSVAALLLILAACGNSQEAKNESTASSTASNSTQDNPSPVNPGSLPPPSAMASEAQDLNIQDSAAFFQRKQVWDTFSPQLQEKILKTYSKSSSDPKKETFNTLFGKVEVEKNDAEIVYVEEIHGQVMEEGDLRTSILAIEGVTGPCSRGEEFLCVSSPRDSQGVVMDAVQVNATLKMSEVALFTATEPVALVSVFKRVGDRNQTLGEYPVLTSDLHISSYTAPATPPAAGSMEPPASPTAIELGNFFKTTPLSGPGLYNIVITAFKDGPEQADPVTKRYVIYRQGIPEFKDGVVKIYPATGDNRNPCDREHEVSLNGSVINVSLSSICVEGQLKDAGTPNVGMVIENSERINATDLRLRYSGNGQILPTTTTSDSEGPIVTSIVPLYDGVNVFKVTVRNSLLTRDEPPANARKNFELNNRMPGLQIKLAASSLKDGDIFDATTAEESKTIQFCLVDTGRQTNRDACLSDWPAAQKPKVVFNEVEIPADRIQVSSGQFSVNVRPMVGANHFSIEATRETPAAKAVYKANFGFGKVNKLYENGQLKERDNFLKRGLSLEINKDVFSVQLKRVLEAFLNGPGLRSTIRNALAPDSSPSGSQSISPAIQCNEYNGSQIEASGGGSVTFTADPTIGQVEVNQIEALPQNHLQVHLTINNLNAQANLLGAVPIDINIRRLVIKFGVRFNKVGGVNKLDIFAVERDAAGLDKVLDIEGAQGFNNFIRIATDRNPAARYYESYTAIFAQTFYDTITKTVLCGLEAGFNDSNNGLARWISDLPKLTNYNVDNALRAALEFEMLGKTVGIDIAYDILHAEYIGFNSQGFKIKNMPLRFSPGPRALMNVPESIRNALVGSLSKPEVAGEQGPADAQTNEHHLLAINLAEDAINQAFFAASFAGLLDIDLDPNFFTNNEIPFIQLVTPTTKDLVMGSSSTKFVDLNQNGVSDDDALPMMLRLRTDKLLAPHIHFLTQSEVNEMAAVVARVRGGGSNVPAEQAISLNTNLKYFKVTLPNLEMSIMRVQPITEENGGYGTFCARSGPMPQQRETYESVVVEPILKRGTEAAEGYGTACKQELSVDYATTLHGSCAPNYEPFTTPIKNGAIISAVPGQAEVPLIRYRSTITLYGAILGGFRETRLQDKFTVTVNEGAEATITPVPNPPLTNFLRIKFLGENPFKPAIDTQVLENHTTLSNSELMGANKIGTILSEAAGTNCEKFNEVRIPVPSQLSTMLEESDEQRAERIRLEGPDSQSTMELLNGFGILDANFGVAAGDLPSVQPSDNRLYLDILAHLGITYPLYINPQVLTDVAIQEILRQNRQGR